MTKPVETGASAELGRGESGRGGLDGLFNPRSIAMIGASSDPRKIGGRPIQFLKSAGFKGPIYPVNPKQTEIQGLPAYPSLAAIPGEVDQAIIALSAAAVPETIEACIAKKVRAVVLFSAGFAEIDAAGRAVQERITARCRANGIRLLGPNCLGHANFVTGAYSTFSHSIEFGVPKIGPIAMVSQSGAAGTFTLVKGVARGLGFSRFIATGNEADVDFADCIAWLADDPATSVILGYFESSGAGRRLIEALERARSARKSVIILKGGASEIGAEAASSHTGALAGADQAYQAVFDCTGVTRARSIDEMLDIAYGCANGVFPAGRRIGVVTGSGGLGVLLADAAADADLPLPPLSQSAQAEIKAVYPLAGALNPVDTTANILNDFSLLPRILAAMMKHGQFDSVIAFLGTIGLDPRFAEPLKTALLEVRGTYPDRLLALCTLLGPELRTALEAKGILVFEDPKRVIATIARLAEIRTGFERPSALPQRVAPAPALPSGTLDEVAAKKLLAAAGIPFPPERVVQNADEAVAAAEALGMPVALKVLSPDIAHKSDIGGVALGLGTGHDVAQAYRTVMDSVRAARPEVLIAGMVVTPMITGGIETVMGIQRDPNFGPVVVFGLGGIYVELLKDVAFRLAPIDEDGAEAMIRSIRGWPLLAGARGRKGSDVKALARALAALSRFGASHEDQIEGIDINPFIALPQGGVAVDALIVRRPKSPSALTAPLPDFARA